MSGAAVVKPLVSTEPRTERIMLNPDMAADMLAASEAAGFKNRPPRRDRISSIARAITAGQWRFNGEALKIGSGGELLDGQHRCWAVIEAGVPVETDIVRNLPPDVFVLLDTDRTLRTPSDTLAISGVGRHRSVIAAALLWMVRWERGCVPTYRDGANRVSNMDVDQAFRDHPGMVDAVARAMTLRRITTPSLLGFFFYVLAARNERIAEAMMVTLENARGIGVTEPFFALQSQLLNAQRDGRREPDAQIAIMIKAANAYAAKKPVKILSWKRGIEPFPALEVGADTDAV